jgi:hypothetical protein
MRKMATAINGKEEAGLTSPCYSFPPATPESEEAPACTPPPAAARRASVGCILPAKATRTRSCFNGRHMFRDGF